jgi:hypothetical protein
LVADVAAIASAGEGKIAVHGSFFCLTQKLTDAGQAYLQCNRSAIPAFSAVTSLGFISIRKGSMCSGRKRRQYRRTPPNAPCDVRLQFHITLGHIATAENSEKQQNQSCNG